MAKDKNIGEWEKMAAERMTKNRLVIENENMKCWLGYIQYRIRHNYQGMSAEYICMDLQNILTRATNDFITDNTTF